jgi:hypothetical protein
VVFNHSVSSLPTGFVIAVNHVVLPTNFFYRADHRWWFRGLSGSSRIQKRKMQRYKKVGGAQFWTKVEGELERAVDPAHDMPPEKKRKLLSQIHILVERWRPFVAEVAPLFADFQKASSAEGPQGGK